MSTTVFPEAGDQITEAAWSAQNKALAVGAAYRVSGYTLSAGAGLAVSVAAGEALVEGYHIVSDGAQTVGSLTASNVNYIWLEADGTLDKNTTGSPSATGALLLGTATTDGSSVTAVSHDHNVTNTFNIYRKKAADETVNNSTTFQDDDTLQFDTVLGQHWEVVVVLGVSQASATPKIKIRWEKSTGTLYEGSWYMAGEDDDGADTVSAGFALNGGDMVIQTVACSNVGVMIRTTMSAVPTGTVKLQWAQNVADASDTKVLTGSWLYARRILS
jgi:hypothetical protein